MIMKGNGMVSWCGVTWISSDMQEIERTMEGGGADLLNKVWHSTVVEFGFVSSRILWHNFKLSRFKVCTFVEYISTKEIMKNERGPEVTWTGFRIQ